MQAGDHQAGLVAGEDARLIAVRAELSRAPTDPNGLQAPFRMPSGGAYTLVLTARKAPYTLRDLIALQPETMRALPDKSFLIEENVVVAGGATLALGGGAPLTVRLQSDGRAFTSLVSLGGRLQLQGSAAAPLTITSWDPGTSTVDNDLSDGRAYIRAIDGTALIDHVTAADLGFWSGRTGGVALTGSNRPSTGVVGGQAHDARQQSRTARAARKAAAALRNATAAAKEAARRGLPALAVPPVATVGAPDAGVTPTGTQPVAPITGTAITGEIANSTFTGNAFGLFISDAEGVHVHDTTVQSSLADGVVLHHFVAGAAIDRVTSKDNAGVGFVLSRGVQGTVLNSDTASRNRKDGFMLSGRPLASGPSSSGQSSTPYGNNELISSTSNDNGRAGVQIVSGHSETVQATRISGNAEGIIVGAGATGTVLSGNNVQRSSTNGITIRDGSEAVVTGNTVSGGGTGIVVRNARADLRSNVVTQASRHGLAFVGTADRSSAVGNILSGRGSSAIDRSRSTHRSRITVSGNTDAGWIVAHHGQSWVNSVLQPMNVTLAVLFAIIVLGSFGTRRRNGRLAAERHPYAMTQSLWQTREQPQRSFVDLTDGSAAAGKLQSAFATAGPPRTF